MTHTPRILFYVQHLLGIGHLARTSRIASALAQAGASVTVVTGGMPVPGFPGPGVTHITLPAIAAGTGFVALVDANGQPLDDAFKAHRRDALLAAFHSTRPDVVVTEAFPFGRRQVRFELLPLIDAINAANPRPVLCTSIRDILQTRAKPGRDEETVALVRDHYDHVLVHGDPAFVRLEDTFPLAAQVASKILYTGLVAAPVPDPSPDQFDIVVSAGGGAVGAGVLHAALEASRALPQIKRWCLIAGPNLPQEDFDRFGQNLREGVELTRFRTDFMALLGAARLSVSQAGYNTVCDILGAGCRALLVPFASGGETEQTARADRFAALGRMTSLPEDQVTPAAMATAITATLNAPLGDAGRLKTDGAMRSAQILMALAQGNPPYMSIT
jgi:predicted glycosyltransferase